MRLIFMGTPAFAVPTLAALYEAQHDICAIYTQPPRPAGRGQKESLSAVHQFALMHGLPVFTPVSLKSSETQATFAAHKADAAIVAAYGLLLPKPILDACPLGCINIHPSLLPRWRGAAPIQRCVMAGDKETGVNIMQMDEGLDTGDILAVAHYPIPHGTTAGALHDHLAQEAGGLLLTVLMRLQQNLIQPVKQSDEGVVYAKKIGKEECYINWHQSAEQIYHHILGLSPSPCAYFICQGEVIKIIDATFSETPAQAAPGTVLDAKLTIACNPGILYPTQVQRAGKKRMSVEELLKGFPIQAGTILSGHAAL